MHKFGKFRNPDFAMIQYKHKRGSIILVISLLLFIIVSGALLIRRTWVTNVKLISERALKTALTTEIALDEETILELHGVIGDTATAAYKTIKKHLIEIRAVQSEIRFIYLYTQRDGKIYFQADSEPVDSKDYSFPGQEYLEVHDEDKQPFSDKQPIITKPSTDQWGTWVSVLVPVMNMYTGEIVSVLGMDYPADKWNTEALIKTKQTGIISFLSLVMSILLMVLIDKNRRLKYEKFQSDITKEEFARSEARYRGLITNLDSGVIVLGTDTSICLNNPRAAEILGFREEQLKGMLATDPQWKFLSENSETIPVEYSPINLIIRYRKPLKNYILGFIRPVTKDIVWLMVNGIPVFDNEGKLSEIVISFLDITERREAEEALKKSETNVRIITDSAQDAVIFMDAEGLVSYWNPAATRIFGYTHDEAMGQSLHMLIAPLRYHEVHNISFSVFKKTGEGPVIGKTIDLDARRKDGTELPVQISISATKIDGEWNSVGIIRDITNRKVAERKLKDYTDQIEIQNMELQTALTNAETAKKIADEMTDKAEVANKSKSLFLANMSHEIRTPLNAIIGFSRLIDRDPIITGSQKIYLRSIISAGEHLLTLINDILELSKLEAGRVVLNPVNVDLYTLFPEIQSIFTEQAKSKHLQFLFETSGIIERYVLVDEKKLRQIFINLIGNAIKFTDEGGVAVRVRVDKTDENSHILSAEIEDSGQGIPENEIDNLFKHFVQTSSGMKSGSGTGLGLILSREFARMMGGDITVSSQEGAGSVFRFNVKVNNGESAKVEPDNNKRIISIDKGEKEIRILVVDDKKQNLMVAVNFLKLVGFTTNEAVNGEDAIRKFDHWCPDLILMDMRMPVMDGYEATKRIKSTERGKKTPVIALTASAFEEEKSVINSLDIQGYLRKPFKENDLFHVIGKALGLKYNYENEVQLPEDNKVDEEVLKSIENIPVGLASEMSNAVSVADLDKLISLIKLIDPENSKLAKYLMTLATRYDYLYLQQILIKKK